MTDRDQRMRREDFEAQMAHDAAFRVALIDVLHSIDQSLDRLANIESNKLAIFSERNGRESLNTRA